MGIAADNSTFRFRPRFELIPASAEPATVQRVLKCRRWLRGLEWLSEEESMSDEGHDPGGMKLWIGAQRMEGAFGCLGIDVKIARHKATCDVGSEIEHGGAGESGEGTLVATQECRRARTREGRQDRPTGRSDRR